MSVTLSIAGNNSLLESYFQPPLTFGDQCECGLLNFTAVNSIPNITSCNNIFSYDNKKLEIPVGNYDLESLVNYLENNIHACDIIIKASSNTLKCYLYCSKTVNFDVENCIGKLLGFSNVKLEANKWHESVNPVNILPLSVIRIECDLVQGSYINGLPSHIVHEFIPDVPPGYRFIEVPKNIIYLPVTKNSISSLTIKVVDESGNFIDFRGETVQLRLHLRKSK